MGLFDNLFLDANTPVTINDGIDHSEDVIAPPKPSGGSPGSGTSGDDGTAGSQKDDTKKKDEALVTLFDDPKKAEERKSSSQLSPAAPDDVALVIGHGPAGADTSPVIDIGGDITFDIGGDITFSDDTSSTQTTPEELLKTEFHSLSSGGVKSDNPQHSTSLNDASQESKLNNELPTASLPPPVIDIAGSSGEISPTIVSTNNNSYGEGSLEGDVSPLFSFVSEGSSPVDTLDEIVTGPTAPKKDEDIKEVVSLDLSVPDSFSERITGNSSTIPSSSSSPRLSMKLSQFLSELENMEYGDQSEKEHKKQQIEMYKTRILEIRADCEMRVHALQVEIQSLEMDLQMMEGEKSRIKKVIETLQKETVAA